MLRIPFIEMRTMRIRRVLPRFLCILLVAVGASGVPGNASFAYAQELATVELASVDAVFQAFDATRTPGCVVGVSIAGAPVLLRAYGMADLEHDVPNTAETIMEPGSVAKQFTATATVLLALDGLISLDDDIRSYIPELPDYGDVVTIRHLLNHTSGLRDWGSVAGIEGWPRTRRAHTHMHVLDIASRQMSLNYPPGEYYSYTNTGYNLQAILVERVSGMPFAQFSKERIFEPLGMTRTQWRDDFTRIVKDRAIAYSRNREGSWFTLMPFEDVHGNGGLLTTVEDLLKFTQNLETGELWGPRYLEEMHTRGVLTSGDTIHYASGLRLTAYKGLRQVEHSGSTAGYRGHLTRFPDQGLALAVMCNTTTGNAGARLHRVADLFLGGLVAGWEPTLPADRVELSADRMAGYTGNYMDERRGELETIRAAEDGLLMGRTLLVPASETRFESAGGTVLEFEATPTIDGRRTGFLSTDREFGIRLVPVPEFNPSEADLAEFTGAYRSDEAEATYWWEVREGTLVMKNRWGQTEEMTPLYPDAFGSGGEVYIFRRDASGRITEVSLSQGRVWDLRFRKLD